MIPLIPTLALTFFSFICSAFIILRIIVPILPPSPLSRRVSPSEFGLPNLRPLSLTNKSHLWLHSLDLLSLIFFIWEVFAEAGSGIGGWANSTSPAASVRLWIVLTIRQTCFLILTLVALVQVRMGLSVSYGAKHWMLWAPTLLLAITSTALAGVLSGAGLTSLYVGLVAYTSFVALCSSAAIVGLVSTLVRIKRNLAIANDESSPWPPKKHSEERPRPSFATEDIDAIKDGASWITSNASASTCSRRESISGWSFSTHHTISHSQQSHGQSHAGAKSSGPPKSAFWFKSSSPPPVPPLPSQFGPLSPTSASLRDEDPFKRHAPTPPPDEPEIPHDPRPRLGSQTSWLTSTNGNRTTVSAWSFPTTYHDVDHRSVHSASSQNLNADLATAVSRPVTPGFVEANVLGGYGYNASSDTEKNLTSLAVASGVDLDISFGRIIGWLLSVWIPLGLAYPYVITSLQHHQVSMALSVLLSLSVTISAPILTINAMFSPLPIPEGLFESRNDLPPFVPREPSPMGSLPAYKWSHEYKRSTSVSITPTVVEGRRSGDVWVTNGDATDGKGKMSRAFSMLAPQPQLSVLPPEDNNNVVGGDLAPVPIEDEDSSLPVNIHNTPSENSAQFGRLRKDSKASSFYSGLDESLAYASQVMIAQRHYSALPQTFKISSAPEDRVNDGGKVVQNTGATVTKAESRRSSHLRARSVSSVASANANLVSSTPPPSIPLPPTPPNVRAAKLARHKKSYSSSGYSFSAVDDMNEIDALTAGVLPLLVPGLKVGENMKIKDGDWTPPGTFSKSKDKKLAQMLQEFGGDFSSPEIHSTPAAARARNPRGRKTSSHKRNHWSLPSLSLGKDGLLAWGADLGRVLENTISQYTAVPSNVNVGRRNTIFGGETSTLPRVREADENPASTAGVSRALSTRSLGLRPEVPHGVDTARSSMASVNINVLPSSAASTATLFEINVDTAMNIAPEAESTPHNNANRHRQSEHNVPPLPSGSGRSSIVYIRSEDVESGPAGPSTSSTSAMASLAQWSSRAVRPLIAKSTLQRNNSANSNSGTSGSPGRGLRPLSLLQARDTNVVDQLPGTRPLVLAKKTNTKLTPKRRSRDENSNSNVTDAINSKNVKSLQLARSETSKVRGILRQQETLPNVVVRPPSSADHMAYAYTTAN